MQQISTIAQLQQLLSRLKPQTLGLVPTMGYLHRGHQALMHAARANCDVVIVSIFVNPLQFGPHEDLDRYPRDLASDLTLCAAANVDIVFTPSTEELLGTMLTSISVAKLDQFLCGKSRPGHFTGVCTIVNKLFNLIQPNYAYFGQKDLQQLRIIQQMVSDLNCPVQVIGVETVRDADGLALSSRNSYLTASERRAALIVPQVLDYVSAQIKLKAADAETILAQAKNLLGPHQRLDYLEIVAYSTLTPTRDLNQALIIATAIYIGTTRLIDNRNL